MFSPEFLSRARGATSAEAVLAAAAAEACRLLGAGGAVAARVSAGAVVAIAESGTTSGLSETVVVDLAARVATEPTVRTDDLLAVSLTDAAGATDGILVVVLPSPPAGASDSLVGLGSLVSLALESAAARERLTLSNRSREILLASVSHDLRNPLNTFAMSAGLLRDDLERNDIDATRGLGLVTRMERALGRMQSLIEDLLEASKIDARRIDYAIRAENAAKIVRDAVKAGESLVVEKGPRVEVDAVDEALSTTCDRARTLQALAKTITYASKATGEGGSIRLSVARLGSSVVFSTRAFGPGGAPVPLPEEGRGGLALLMARGLVEGQHGTFRVESGGALAVTFALPSA